MKDKNNQENKKSRAKANIQLGTKEVVLEDAYKAYEEKNYKKVFEPFKEVFKQGLPEDQYNLGWMYAKGYGVDQDYMKAFEWYEKAAEQGYPTALYNLGVMYAKGYGVDQDYTKAFEWFEKAAEQGEVKAIKALEELKNEMNGDK